MQDQRLQQLQQAVARDPRNPALHYDLGNLLLNLGQPQPAADCFRAALRLVPEHPQLLLQLGNAYSAQGRYEEAAVQFRACLRRDPTQAAGHYNLGNALREQGRPKEAAACYRESIRLDPTDADAHNNLGNVLREVGQLDQAIACYREALRLNPSLHHARLHLLHQRQHVCDWTDWDSEIDEVRRLVREEPRAQISPFAFMSLPGATAAEQRLCSEHWAANRFLQLPPDAARLQALHTRPAGERLRIGYLSADFRQHPMTTLGVELVELYDRQAFELFGYSYGPNDKSAERQRWERAFDHFRDIRPLSSEQAAQRIYDDRVDILIDYTGYTQNSRSGILALRPAPLQVNWLGFPGTLGAPFADYLIADPIVIPPSEAVHYSENLVYMPGSYQSNNYQRPDTNTPSRADCGLPEQAFVFCCFNQTFKITPQVFDNWMEILRETAGSVLWLLECNVWAKGNLLREAKARGVDPERLIFAPRADQAEHLARQRCADLFLDTRPYNAHTSTSDALWVGLPVLTCTGDTFPARVAASLLQAADLPELITETPEAFVATAISLARDPQRLQALRARLLAQRDTLPLFDTPAFARHVEQAYRTMWQRHAAGLAPAGFSVV